MALKRIPSLLIPDSIDSVWMLTVELWKVASVGGLGKVVYNLARELARQGIDVKVIMPSHGRHLSSEYRSLLNLKEINITAEGERIGVNGQYYHYKLGFEEGGLDGFKVVLVKGLDYETGKIIDNWVIYSEIEEKASLFAKAVEIYSLHSIPSNIPSLIHIHDWHTVLAGVKAKQVFELRRIIIPLVFSIHLINQRGFPWHYASVEWSGIRDESHYVWFPFRHVLKSYREIWDVYSKGDIEKFGMYESDVIVSVSKSYLEDEILKRLGDWYREKCCVV
ncbi:MAG: glycogen/starch synthase, partial [Sulfolobaceae archaeon]